VGVLEIRGVTALIIMQGRGISLNWRRIHKNFPWQLLKHFIGIVIGATIVGASINTLIIPNQIADGGITGIAIILHYLFHWPVSWAVLLLNLPLFILGFRMVGRNFLIFSVAAVCVLSATLSLTTHLPVLTHDTLQYPEGSLRGSGWV